jgi:hypothetical protein
MGTLTLPASGSVYIDANAVTYSVERIESYHELLAPMWDEARAGRCILASSELVQLETLIRPLREGDARLETLFMSILDAADMNLVSGTLLAWDAVSPRTRFPALATAMAWSANGEELIYAAPQNLRHRDAEGRLARRTGSPARPTEDKWSS